MSNVTMIASGLAFRASRPGAWRSFVLSPVTQPDSFALIRRVIDANLAERERDLVQKLAAVHAHLEMLS